MRLQLSRLALDDIDLVHDYTLAHWGEAQAVRYVNALWDALEEIQQAPERWRVRPDIYPGCRARACGSHLIVYRVRDGDLQIGRILHRAMNLKDHIPRSFMGDE